MVVVRQAVGATRVIDLAKCVT